MNEYKDPEKNRRPLVIIGLLIVIILLILLLRTPISNYLKSSPKNQNGDVESVQSKTISEYITETKDGKKSLLTPKIVVQGDIIYEDYTTTLPETGEDEISDIWVNTSGDIMTGDLAITEDSQLILSSIDSLLFETSTLSDKNSSTDSGAYLIGTYDEFSNSDGTNIQSVLDDLDEAIENIEVPNYSYTETDPVFASSPASSITNTQISHWNEAYSWGDHSIIGYITSESDTLATVTGRGASTSTQVLLNGGARFPGSGIWNSSGNVGIGTVSPQESLDISGAIRIGSNTNANAGTIRWTGTDFEGHTGSGWVSLTPSTVADIWVDEAGDTMTGNLIFSSADLNIATNNIITGATTISSLELDILDSGIDFSELTGSIGDLQISAGAVDLDTSEVAGILPIANGGTNASTYSLTEFIWFDGTRLVTSGYDETDFLSSTTDNWVNETGDTMSGTLTFSAVATDITTGTDEDLVIIPNGTGYVGINDTSPDSMLDINDNILEGTGGAWGDNILRIENSGDYDQEAGMLFLASTTDLSTGWPTGRIYGEFDGNGYDDARITIANITEPAAAWVNTITFKAGDVGIGTISPDNKLDVVGDTNITRDTWLASLGGNVSIGTTDSSARLLVTKSIAENQNLVDFVDGTSSIFFIEDGGDVVLGTNEQAHSNSTWTMGYDGSAGGIHALAEFNDFLYAGLGDVSSGSGDILVCDPTTNGDLNICDDPSDWQTSFAATNQEFVLSLAEYNGKLYAGMGISTGDGDIYECDPTTTGNLDVCETGDWSISYNGSQEGIYALAVYNGHLYAGQGGADLGIDGDIFVFDGSTWSIAYTGSTESILSLAVYNGKLYAGRGVSLGNGDILGCDPTAGGDENLCDNAADFSVSYNGSSNMIKGFAVYDEKLFAAQAGGAGTDGDVLVCDSTIESDQYYCESGEWRTSFDGPQDSIESLATHGGVLYAGQGNDTGDGDIYYFDGSGWKRTYDGSQEAFESMVSYNHFLYAGQTRTSGDGDIYYFRSFHDSSYPLKFQAGSGDETVEGSIWFERDDLNGTSGGSGAGIGTFKLSHSLITTSGSYDIAEQYSVLDESIEAGEVMSLSGSTDNIIEKSWKKYDRKVVGVVSTNPGIALTESNTRNSRLVALAGRVPVKFSPENGPVQKGDYLVSSSTPGYAMNACGPKYCRSGKSIGTALENRDLDGKVLMFVNLSWFQPETDRIAIQNIISDYEDGSLTTGSLDNINNLFITGSLTAQTGNFSNVTINNLAINNQLTVRGILTTRNIKANIIESFSSSDIILKLSEHLGDTSFRIEDEDRNLIFKVDSTGKLYLKEDTINPSIGNGLLKRGEDQVRIYTESVTEDSKIFITPTIETDKQLSVIEKAANDYFVVKVTSPVDYDIKFDWWIVN